MKWMRSNKLCVYSIPMRGLAGRSAISVSDSRLVHCSFEYVMESDKRGEK